MADEVIKSWVRSGFVRTYGDYVKTETKPSITYVTNGNHSKGGKLNGKTKNVLLGN